ncbi:MAG: thiolase family protein [Bdellovibrionota bacterium]
MTTTTTVRGFHSKRGGSGSVFEEIYLVAGKRTPFGKYCGSLASLSPTDLGIFSSRAVLAEAKIPAADIDQTIVANIGQASADSFFLPRHIALYSGAPLETPALLVQRICGSGLEVIGQAAEQIAIGKAQVVLGCGTESMSRFPLVSYGARQGFPLGKPEFLDLLWEALNDTAAMPMGQTADQLAKKMNLTRREVDTFAERSQFRYQEAQAAGFFRDEIVPVPKAGSFEAPDLKPRKFRAKEALDRDEHPRPTSLAQLGLLPPVFSPDGPTTAGSASGIVDGSCSLILASGEYVRARGLKPLARILGYAAVGVEPGLMGIGPSPAIRTLLAQLQIPLSQIDRFEINEAFGAQCLAVARDLELDEAKLNVNGGAIALGHPLAATGLRLALTAARVLRRDEKRLAVAAACIGGGQGIALALERA